MHEVVQREQRCHLPSTQRARILSIDHICGVDKLLAKYSLT